MILRFQKLRMMFAALAVSALLALTPQSPLTLSLHVQRTSLDLLDVLGVEIIVDNRSAKPFSVGFPGPQEYVLSVRRATGSDAPVFATPMQTPPPGVTIAGHTRSLQPGANVLATYEWNELSDARQSLKPGRYIIEARMLAEPHVSATTIVTFVPPVPVSAIEKLAPAEEITVAGTLSANGGTLSDSTGSIALSRHLAVTPGGTVAVRGAITLQPDGPRTLTVERWAPLP